MSYHPGDNVDMVGDRCAELEPDEPSGNKWYESLWRRAKSTH